MELRFVSVNTGTEIHERLARENVRIMPNGTTDIIVDDIIDHTGYPEPHVLAARVWVDGHIAARDVDWPQPFKYLDLSDRGLDVTVSESAEGRVLKINTQKPVKCLVFEEQDGKFSDNALDIVPGDEQVVTVSGLGYLKYKYLQ